MTTMTPTSHSHIPEHQLILHACTMAIAGHDEFSSACLFLFGRSGDVGEELMAAIYDTKHWDEQEDLTAALVQLHHDLARGVVAELAGEHSAIGECLAYSHSCSECSRQKNCIHQQFMPPANLGGCYLVRSWNETSMNKSWAEEEQRACSIAGDNPLSNTYDLDMLRYPLCISITTNEDALWIYNDATYIDSAHTIGSHNRCRDTRWGELWEYEKVERVDRSMLVPFLVDRLGMLIDEPVKVDEVTSSSTTTSTPSKRFFVQTHFIVLMVLTSLVVLVAVSCLCYYLIRSYLHNRAIQAMLDISMYAS